MFALSNKLEVIEITMLVSFPIDLIKSINSPSRSIGKILVILNSLTVKLSRYILNEYGSLVGIAYFVEACAL